MDLMMVDSIVSGMVLARDVIDDSGIVLMSMGATISDDDINKLLNMGIDFVYIKDESKDTIKLQKEKSVEIKPINREAMDKAYTKLIRIYKILYSKLGQNASINLEKLSKEVLPLIDEITNESNVLKNLRSFDSNEFYIYTHSVNVTVLVVAIAKWLHFDKQSIDELAMAAFLMNIGDVRLSDELLNKPEALTKEEMFEMMKHPIYSCDILENSTNVSPKIFKAIRYHHERLDGSGYPESIKGDDIPIYSKIIAVADVFDALVSDRPYRKKISQYQATKVLKEESFDKLEIKITDVFLRNIAKFYVGDKVKLSTGEVGEVVLINKFDRERPLIKIADKYFDLSTNYDLEILEVLDD